MPADARATVEDVVVYPEAIMAFGDGINSFAELAAHPEKYELIYKVAREGSDPAADRPYVINIFPASNPSQADWTVTVDPARGYMVTHGITAGDAPGDKLSEFWVTPREVGSGVWFPAAMEKKYYEPLDPATGKQAEIRTFKSTMESIDIDPDIPKSKFEIQSFGFQPEMLIMRWDADGVYDTMRFINDELVPTSLLQSTKRK
jgi:hypothetical protein